VSGFQVNLEVVWREVFWVVSRGPALGALVGWPVRLRAAGVFPLAVVDELCGPHDGQLVPDERRSPRASHLGS